MRFGLTDMHVALADTVGRVIEDTVPETARRNWLGRCAGDDYRDLWGQYAALGVSGLFDEAGSVSGEALVDAAIVAELMGRALVPSPFLGASAAVFALAAASDAQAKLKEVISSGSAIASLALEEAEGKWDVAQVAATAEPDGDDYVVSGTKINVADSADANVFCVVCRLAGEVAVVLVPADAAGVKIEPKQGMDLLRQFGSVHFDHVRVPASAVALSTEAQVRQVARVALCLQMAESVGAADRLFAMTVEYSRSRYAFGRPIGSFQALKHRMADLMLWVEGCKATVDAAVNATTAGEPDADLQLSIAKAYVGDRTVRIAQECTQMFGGIGLTYEHDAHLYLRRLTVNRALLGTPEQHRLRVARLINVPLHMGEAR